MTSDTRSPLVRYGLAVVAVAVAALGRWALAPLYGPAAPYGLFLFAVAFAAWYCGSRAAVLSLALGTLVAVTCFVTPSPGPNGLLTDALNVTMFAGIGLAVIASTDAVRAAEQRAAQATTATRHAWERADSEAKLRDRAEVELRSRRVWFQVAFAHINEAVVTTDAGGRITFMNAAAEKLTGWRATEADGQPLEAVYRLESERTHGPAARVIATGLTEKVSRRAVLRDRVGGEHAIDHHAAPIRDGIGGVEGAVLVFRDVSERVRSERAVRLSEERLRLALEASLAVAWECDPAADTIERSSNAPALLGLPVRGSIEQFLTGMDPAAAGKFQRTVTEAAQTGEPFLQSMRYVRPDTGAAMWLEVRGGAVADGSAQSERLHGIVADVTARHHAEAELARLTADGERQRRVLDTALSHTADFNAVLDRNGRFTYVNVSLLGAWQKDLPEVLGRTFSEIGGPGAVAAGLDLLVRRAIATHRPAKGETGGLWDAPGEEPRRYEAIFVPVIGDDGEVEAVAGSARDVTDRAALEAALRERADELREADRRKDEFLAMLAHELRNPLAPILHGLEVLRRTSTDHRTPAGAMRGMIERQVRHMARLIDDLLDVSRITQGKVALRPEPLDLADCVTRAAETVRPDVDARHQTLTVTLPPGPLPLRADAARLSQVLANLLTNASKYTPDYGRVTLAAAAEGETVVVRITDTGVGIEPAMLGRVFDLFAQGSVSIDRAKGGLGIGLTLVKRLVELHGGTVEADSDGPGRGSTFTVRLPLAPQAVVVPTPQPEPEPAAVNGAAHANGVGRKVLVVDDNVDAAQTVAMLAGLWHHEVRTVHDGLRAVEAAVDFRPDIVLLDIGLPGMSGYEVAKALRQRPEVNAVRIVALTGYGQADDRRRSREAGFDEHLVKPVDPGTLQRVLADGGRG